MRPPVSVIVPTRARPAALARCLRSLAALDYPRRSVEVIVVEDGDGSAADVLDRFARRLDVTLVRAPRRGPAAARNAGAARAGGRFLAFTDDDCLPGERWLAELVARAGGRDVGAVGGRVVNALVGNSYADANQVIVDLVYAHYDADPERAGFLASNNLLVHAERFHDAGGFDESFRTAEDRELGDRLRHLGLRLVYARESVVAHARPATLVEFAGQHFGYGRGAYRYHAVRAARGSGTLRSDLLFHRELGKRVSPLLRDAGGRRALGLLALLSVWQAANAAGFGCEAIRSVALGLSGAPTPSPRLD